MPPTLPGVVTGLPDCTRALGLGLGSVTELLQLPDTVGEPLLTHEQVSAPVTPPAVVTLHVPVCGWVCNFFLPLLQDDLAAL